MNDYAQSASQQGRPIDPQKVEFATTDTNKTLVTVRASHTIYIQRLTYTPTTVAAQAITVQDASTGQKYALIPASQATPYTADFGEKGIPVTAAESLRATATAGAGGIFSIEGYQKLTSVIAHDAAAAIS